MRPPNRPNPKLACAVCLYQLGYGYDRIARRLFLPKHKVYKFISRRVRKRGLKKPAILPKQKVVRLRKDPMMRTAKKLQSKTRRQRVVRLRRYVWRWLFRNFNSPIAESMTGCSRENFKRHIQSKFRHRMTWENYAKHWQLDHIVPCRSFDLSDPEQVKKCFHFSNYQPLIRAENAKKSYKIVTHQPELFLLRMTNDEPATCTTLKNPCSPVMGWIMV